MHLTINTTKPFASADAFLDWLLLPEAPESFSTNVGTVSRCTLWQLIEITGGERGKIEIAHAA